MLETLRLLADRPDDVTQAAALLRAGRLVAFATETVYGLGANALSAEAVAGIFTAKKRPSWDPLIVHLADAEDLAQVANVPAELRERVLRLTQAFWPGPLTLLLPRAEHLPAAVTAGRPLVGVRVPAHLAAQRLLRAAHLPVAAPSANLFGHTSPTTAAHVLADLDGRIDAVLNAGPTPVGLESTVLDPAPTPMVLYRPGAITVQEIERAIGVAVAVFQPGREFDVTGAAEREALPSPGVGIRHYAPRARLRLVGGDPRTLRKALLEARFGVPAERLGVLLPTGWPAGTEAVLEPWGAWDDPAQLAANLFAGLHNLDGAGVEIILCPLPPPGGLRDAIRDRLEKAARPIEG